MVEARPPSAAYRLKKFVRRHKGQVIAASLVLLVLLGGIVGTTLGLIEARQQEEKARGETAEKEEARKAEADRVQERDKANGDLNKANDELKHRLGISAMVLANAAYDSRDYRLTAERLDKVPVEQRGWEWRYVKRQLRGGIFTLFGHRGPVTCVAFSPDGTRMVTGGGDQMEPFEAKVWDARTGMYLFDLKGLPPRLEGDNIPVVCVAFSGDSKRIVTAGGGAKTARVYDATTGALQLELTDPVAGDGVQWAAFSPDGTQIATASGRVKLSDARTGKALLEWKGGATRVSYSADGTRILTGGLDQAVRVWDAPTGKLLFEAKGMMGHYRGVAFSPDGQRIVAGAGMVPGHEDALARVIDARTGAVLLGLKGRPLVLSAVIPGNVGVVAVAFSPDGARIVTGGTTGGFGEASVWDARTGAELLELRGHTGPVVSAAFSPDGTRIITGSEDGTAKVWDARTGAPRLKLEGIKGSIEGAAFSPDGKWIVTVGEESDNPGQAKVWDAQTGMLKFTLKGPEAFFHSVAISKDGTRIATGGAEPGAPDRDRRPGLAAVWDAQTGKPLLNLKGLQEAVSSLAFSPDGARILTGGAGGVAFDGLAKPMNEVKLWDARTGSLLLDLTPPNAVIGGIPGQHVNVASSPDGKQIGVAGARASTTMDDVVTIRDAQTGAALVEMKINEGAVLSMAFSNDRTRIVTGEFDKTATVWDAQTGKVLLELKGHTSSVLSAAFSPDSKRIVTSSADRTVRVWDARTGTTLAELKGHTGGVTSASFSTDGTRILTAGERLNVGGGVFVWDAPIPKQEVELVGHTARINVAAFSPDGSRIATGSSDRTVKVWDPRTGAALLDLKGHAATVLHVAFSADDTRIISSDATTVKVWDAKTGSLLLELKGKPGEMGMVAFSQDGTRIVTGGSRREGDRVLNGVARVWDATKGTPVVEVTGLPIALEGVAFSPDGTRFYTYFRPNPRYEKTIAWDAGTGKEVPGAAIPSRNRSEISPDGRLFARVNGDRVEVIPLVPDEEEGAYRRAHAQPNPSRYRAGYLAARAAKDDFAAAFYLNFVPPDERKTLIAQAEADAFAALSRLVNEYESVGKLEEALPLCIEILNVNKAKLGPEDPATIQAAETVGRVYNRMGQFDKAIPLFEDILKHRKAKLGREDEQTLGAMLSLGWVYRDAGRLKEAIAVLEEEGTKKASLMPHLLDVYALAGEHAKIVAVCLKQLPEVRKSTPNDSNTLVILNTHLGRAYLGQKKWSEAEPHLRENLTLREKENSTDHWTWYDAQSMLGGSLLGQKKYADAEPLLLKGYEGLKQWETSLEPRDAPRVPEAIALDNR